jgi:hypothetical protein
MLAWLWFEFTDLVESVLLQALNTNAAVTMARIGLSI